MTIETTLPTAPRVLLPRGAPSSLEGFQGKLNQLYCNTGTVLLWLRPSPRVLMSMAGLGLFDQKSALAVAMPIVTAFKFCIGHRKNGLLNR